MKKSLLTIVTLCVFASSCTKESDVLTNTISLADKKEQVCELLRQINENSFMVGEIHNKGVVEILKGLSEVTRSNDSLTIIKGAIKQYAMDKADSLLDNCLLKELYISKFEHYYDSVTEGHSNLPSIQVPLLDPLRLANLDSLSRALVNNIDSALVSTDTAQVVVLGKLYKVIQKADSIREDDVRNMVIGMAAIAANSYVFWNELYDAYTHNVMGTLPAPRPTFGGLVKADAKAAGIHITISWILNAALKWQMIAVDAAANSVCELIDWSSVFDFSAVADAIRQRVAELQN